MHEMIYLTVRESLKLCVNSPWLPSRSFQSRNFGISRLYVKKKPFPTLDDDVNLLRKFVKYPDNVRIEVEDIAPEKLRYGEKFTRTVIVSGPLGTLREPLYPGLSLKSTKSYDGLNDLEVVPIDENLRARKTMWGTTTSTIRNMISGVVDGHYSYLEISGIGYKAAIEDRNTIILRLGHAVPFYLEIPPEVKVKLVSPTLIVMFSTNLLKVSQFAAKIRRLKPPEPYKLKGIFVNGETIRKKETKR